MSAIVYRGFPLQLSATEYDVLDNILAGRVVTWASTDPTVATVDSTGRVFGVGYGNCTIIATSEGKQGSLDISCTQNPDGSIADYQFGLSAKFIDWWEPLAAYGGGTGGLSPIIGSRTFVANGSPTYDAVNQRATTNGVSSYFSTGEQAAYDPSTGPKVLVFMSTLNFTVSGILAAFQKHDFSHRAYLYNNASRITLNAENFDLCFGPAPTSAFRLTIVTLVNAVGQVLTPQDVTGTLANPFRSLEVAGYPRRVWNMSTSSALPGGNYEFFFGGAYNGGIVGSGETLIGAGIMNTYPTAADMPFLIRRLLARGGAVMTGQAPLFAAIGDSRTAGTFNSANMSWPSQYQTLVGGAKIVDNRGAPSRTLSEMSRLREILIAADVSPYRTNDTFALLGGINDGGADGPTMAAEYFLLLDRVRALGGKAVAIPEISSTTDRATLNPLLRSSLGVHCDYCPPTDSDGRLQSYTVTYFNNGDPIHPNDAGEGVIAADVNAVVP